MRITEKETDGILIISIHGRFTPDCLEKFRKKLSGTILKHKHIVFDLNDMEYIDGSALHLFCSCHRHLKESGGSLILACMQAGPRIVLNVTKTSRILPVYNTLDAAVTASASGV